MIPKSSYTEKGQAALIVVLISVVVVTVVMASTVRTVSDIRSSTLTVEGARAFSAAEAGIEKALLEDPNNLLCQAGCTVADIGVAAEPAAERPDATYTVLPIPDASVDTYYSMVDTAAGDPAWMQGQTKTVWLTDQPYAANPDAAGQNYYGDVAAENTIAFDWDPNEDVEFLIFYRDIPAGDIIKIRRMYQTGAWVFDWDSFFDAGDHIVRFMRVKPITGNLTGMRVTPSDIAAFPIQGKRIESTGFTPGNVSRTIKVKKWIAELPGIFDFVLYSEGDIRKL
ncbi:hypothetical protein HY468_04750 [Candidatus Roizmanbacteria bacterium]|nr:hypothetical protein [Candidatus Roizmanbacteria bacterium]